MKFLRVVLFPFSVLYSAILRIRNFAFDLGILKSYQASVPTICVGNVSLGGTGKTPHIKFLLSSLAPKKMVVLSRGYGRETKGFYWVQPNSVAHEVGDEPIEIKQFSSTTPVAVCENRVFGIQQILKELPETELILLDDAFQHRKLKCSFYILLTTQSNPFYQDFIIPSGYLRDNRKEAKRASATIVTKVKNIEALDSRMDTKIQKYSEAPVFYSQFQYTKTLPSLSEEEPINIDALKNRKTILLTGIANPDPFLSFWKDNSDFLTHIDYPDHHTFTIKDILKIQQIFDSFADQNPVILTTEKDSVRLAKFVASDNHKTLPIYISGIEVRLDNKQRLLTIINKHISTFNYVN
jgi:tetraacyldisaccharide 4'-kinase